MALACFPTLFSTPHPDGLAEQVLPYYSLPQPIHCELHRAGRNDHYRVHAGGDTYYLKVPGVSDHWQTQAQHRARLESEVGLLNHLRAHGIPTPTPVPRVDGAYLSPIQAPEGVRYAMLFHSAPGRPLGDRDIRSEQVHRVATLVARMHNCMDLLPDDFTPVNWDLHWIVEVPLEQLRPVLRQKRTDWAYLQELGETVKHWIENSLPPQKPEYGVIHGDLHQDNILVHEDGLLLIDSESFGRGWRAWEIAYYLSGNFSDWVLDPQREAERQRRREAFLESYLAERPLSEAERASILVFTIARILVAMGRAAGLNARFEGQEAARDERVDEWLTFLRQWIEHYRIRDALISGMPGRPKKDEQEELP